MLLKHKVIVFLLAIMTSFLSISIFSDNYIFYSVMRSIESQNARIDLMNAGSKNNTVKLLDYDADNTELISPNWFKRSNGIGKVLQFKMKRRWRSYSFTFQAIGDGTLNIQFRGKERKIDNRRYPALVDFNHIYVNEKKYADTRKTVWHDKPYSIKIKVKDGDKIVLNMEGRKHIFRMSDFHKFYHTNFRMVLAVFIISCLFYSFLVNMYVKGRKMGGHRIDMLFIVLFFIILVIPMIHISDKNRSIAENRNLAIYDPMVKYGKFNMNYGNKVDKWFNDRFFGRENIMGLYFSIVLKLNKYPSIGGAIYNSKTNWMFNLYQINNRKSVDDKKIKEINNVLNNFNHYIENKNIKLYFLIVPAKVDIYRDDAKFYKNISDIRYGDLIENIKNESQFPVIFPYKELVEFSKHDFVFFKTDHHWTDWGAFAGYQALMDEIKKDFIHINIADIDDYIISYNKYVRSDWGRDFHKGQTANLLGQHGSNQDFLDVKYSYYDPKNNIKHEIQKRDGKYTFKYFKNDGNNSLRAIICGTSMNEDLLQFIPQSFNEVLYIRLNNVQKVSAKDQYKIQKLYDKYISEFNPDLFILCLTESNLSNLINLMKD